MERTKTSTGSGNLGGDAKELATTVVDQAKGFVGEQIQDRQAQSADQIGKVAKALQKTGEELSDTMAGPYVERAAAALDRASSSVRNASFRDIVGSTERFAKENPVLFIGGAFALGVLAARFLKSSAPRETQPLLGSGADDDMMDRKTPVSTPTTRFENADALQRRSRMGSSPPPIPTNTAPGLGNMSSGYGTNGIGSNGSGRGRDGQR